MSYYTTNQAVFKVLKDFFEEKMEADRGVDKEALILNIITQYPISEKKVREHIFNFYIKRGVVREQEGILFLNKKDVKEV